MKEKIAIIGANCFQNKLILKAKELGFETHVFAWKSGDIGEETADFFYPVSITEKEIILDKCRQIKPVAICSIASDLAVLTVNYVARKLGLTANSEYCDDVSTNKFLMRTVFKEAGIHTPHFIKVSETERENLLSRIHEFTFPIIVKPTDRSGSRAITKLESADGLEKALNAAFSESFEHAAIIEEYLLGKEYSCECISRNGEHHMLAITEKFTTGAPHFIETGHFEPAPLADSVYENVKNMVFQALDALQIKNGASHTEFKISDAGDMAIIETGARMGGDCIGSDLVFLSTGMDYVKMVIDVACGKQPALVSEAPGRDAAIRFVMSEKDRELAQRMESEFEYYSVSNIDENCTHKIVDSSSRYGYFIVADDSSRRIKEKMFELE